MKTIAVSASVRPGEVFLPVRYVDFLEKYTKILTLACRKLKENRFAIVVVGEIRDGKVFIGEEEICSHKKLAEYEDKYDIEVMEPDIFPIEFKINDQKTSIMIPLIKNVCKFYKINDDLKLNSEFCPDVLKANI